MVTPCCGQRVPFTDLQFVDAFGPDTPLPQVDDDLGVQNLALAARKTGAVLVHFSTDYVFDGPGRSPYEETDLPFPKCIYGVSKLAGEFTDGVLPRSMGKKVGCQLARQRQRLSLLCASQPMVRMLSKN